VRHFELAENLLRAGFDSEEVFLWGFFWDIELHRRHRCREGQDDLVCRCHRRRLETCSRRIYRPCHRYTRVQGPRVGVTESNSHADPNGGIHYGQLMDTVIIHRGVTRQD